MSEQALHLQLRYVMYLRFDSPTGGSSVQTIGLVLTGYELFKAIVSS